MNVRTLSLSAAKLSCLLFIVSSAAACTPVEFYQKQNLNDPIMQFDPDRAEVHFHQKSRFATEGSAGGIGSGAGGGCGCF